MKISCDREAFRTAFDAIKNVAPSDRPNRSCNRSSWSRAMPEPT